MRAIKTVTPTDAAKWLDIDVRTFKEMAKKMGFTRFPGTTESRVRYSKDDILEKMKTPIEDAPIKKKKRGQLI